MQPARGVDDHRVKAEVLRFGQRAPGAHDRVQLARRVVHAQAGLLAQHVQLLDRGGPPDVGRDQQDVTSLLGQPLPQFAAGRRLARALQPEHHDHARPLIGLLQAAGGVAKQRQHFVADDPDDLLSRGQTAQDLLVERPVAHPVDKRLDHLEVDVGFEQRQANLSQGRLDRGLGEASFSTNGAEDVLQAATERVEHHGVWAPAISSGRAIRHTPSSAAQTLILAGVSGSGQTGYTDDSLWPSLSFLVFRYLRVNSVAGMISRGSDSETDSP